MRIRENTNLNIDNDNEELNNHQVNLSKKTKKYQGTLLVRVDQEKNINTVTEILAK